MRERRVGKLMALASKHLAASQPDHARATRLEAPAQRQGGWMPKRGRSWNKHRALLSGLLHCASGAARMVYSYSGKNDRRYPYYVCLNAQPRGWAACPAKSLSARGIEESVLGQIREAQHGIFDSAEWERMDRTQQVEAIQTIVERIGYDGDRA